MLFVRDVLKAAQERIAAASESASLDAQLLLCEVLGVERAYILARPEHVLTPEQADRFAALVDRAAAGEPIAYILGRRAFYDREFLVTPDVLIPRPETELLLEQALEWAKQRSPVRAVDVGTGSGALAVTLAAHVPNAEVYAVDASPAALDVARANAERHAAHVRFVEGDLLTPFLDTPLKFDLVMANLPYIPSGDLAGLAVSRCEPRLALDGGADGLDLIRRLIAQIPQACAPGALILLEIGAGQGAAVIAATQAIRPRSAEVLRDYARLERIVRIEL
jgi:release factor glutamine methyltransferase